MICIFLFHKIAELCEVEVCVQLSVHVFIDLGIKMYEYMTYEVSITTTNCCALLHNFNIYFVFIFKYKY